jgi:MFS family permease
MSSPHQHKLLSWLPALSYQVWILALGRLLSQTGSGFTLFYAPIFFVNQVGLSATLVGIGLGCQSISGVVGRFLGGTFVDSHFWGRRRTLLLSAVISAIASFILALSSNFPLFVAGNLFMGLGIGLYWPSAETMIADLTNPAQRNEAYALNRLGDSLGLGLGVVLGGLLIGVTGAYRALFIIDGVSFLVLFGVVLWALAETHQPMEQDKVVGGWRQALGDRCLLTYCIVNILFTTYIVQISSTMPLYFTNFIQAGRGFAPETLSALFTWHLIVCVLLQLPVARALNRFSRPHALMLSILLWGMGFLLVWATAVAPLANLVWATLALTVLGLATVTYLPAASSIVVEMAPDSLRGVYLAVNSQCWAIGYFIGPPLGGWALDQSRVVAHGFWLGLSLSMVLALLILQHLKRLMEQSLQNSLNHPQSKISSNKAQ